MVPLSANRFLEMMTEVTVGWLLLDAAVIADVASKTVDPTHLLRRQGPVGDLLRAQHPARGRLQGRAPGDGGQVGDRHHRRGVRHGLNGGARCERTWRADLGLSSRTSRRRQKRLPKRLSIPVQAAPPALLRDRREDARRGSVVS